MEITENYLNYVDNEKQGKISETEANQNKATAKVVDEATEKATDKIATEDALTETSSTSYENATYSREDLEYHTLEDTLADKLMENLKGKDELKLLPVDPNLPHEIYAISISDGKVHVQGGEGYEDKARAYEELLNASLKYQFQWKWGGRAMDEETVLNSLADTLKYYYQIDDEIVRKDANDSIVNHVGEAFDRWYQENKPKGSSFLARA